MHELSLLKAHVSNENLSGYCSLCLCMVALILSQTQILVFVDDSWFLTKVGIQLVSSLQFWCISLFVSPCFHFV